MSHPEWKDISDASFYARTATETWFMPESYAQFSRLPLHTTLARDSMESEYSNIIGLSHNPE